MSCCHNSIVVDLDFRIKLYTVNNLLLLVERYLAKLTPITDDLNTASGSATESIAEMRKLLVLLDDTLVYNDTILSQLQSFCAEMKSAGDTMLTGLDAIENALSLIEGGLSVPDTTQLRSDTEKLLASLVQLNEAIDTAAKEYQDTGSVSKETQKKLNSALQTTFTDYAGVILKK